MTMPCSLSGVSMQIVGMIGVLTAAIAVGAAALSSPYPLSVALYFGAIAVTAGVLFGIGAIENAFAQ